MSLFGFFKKKDQTDNQAMIEELKAFSKLAIDLAIPEILSTGSFLPFGGVLTTDNTFQQVIYHNPEARNVDHRQHATIIQNLIKKKYKEPSSLLIMMAFDGIAHLESGDIDAITVRVSHKPTNTHRLLTYPYKVVNNEVQLVDIEHPVIKKF